MATVTREREEQDGFDAQMRLLQRAARHCDKREDDDAAEACRWAASRMQHERSAALAAPPAEDEKMARDSEPRYSQIQLDGATKPLHAEIERLKAQTPPASDPPGMDSEISQLRAWKADHQQALMAMAVELISAGFKGDGVLDGIKWLAARQSDPPGLVALSRQLLEALTHEIVARDRWARQSDPNTVRSQSMFAEVLAREAATRDAAMAVAAVVWKGAVLPTTDPPAGGTR